MLNVVPTTGPALAVQFHGAIAASTEPREGSLNAGDQHPYDITVTAPGLLTAETTGSTDTKGMLTGTEDMVDAMADAGGSGNNFKIAVPVTGEGGDGDYTVFVSGQTPTTTGAYILDMDFKVAMVHDPGVMGVTGVVANDLNWGTDTAVPDDDGPDSNGAWQIKRIAEDGNRVDADYFLFTIDENNSGFLTVGTTDDTTAARDSDTTGTLYGPTGEITRDTSSGPGNHFQTRTPVQEEMTYLVKVEGTDGVYQLKIALAKAEGGASGGDLIAVPGTDKCTS